MHYTKTLVFFIIINSIAYFSYSQSQCDVLIENLKGTYEGECKRGKAHGKGTAQGQDSYEGSFKKGYPHGEGLYQWYNGNTYQGGFSAGLMNGEGKMIIKRRQEPDSVLEGYWKAGSYIGKYLRPYKVLYKQNAKSVKFKNLGDENGVVDVRIRRNGNNAVITSISALALSEGNDVSGPDGLPRFEQVKFPFSAVIEYVTPAALNGESPITGKLEFTIYEEGRWEVTIETC